MANKPKIGASVQLDGEKQFKESLSQINAGLKVNASEMQLVAASYTSGGKSVADLTAKGQVLEKQIASQTDKVKKLEEALAASAAKNGESSKKTMEWQVSLNQAKASLTKMTGELGENQQAMARTQKSGTSLADAIKGIAQTAGVDIPPAMQGMVNKLDGVSASGAALAGVVAGMVASLGKMTVATAKTADDILTLSSTTGLSTDALQEFNYASELLDVSSETMQGSMTKMIRSMSAASNGTKEAADAYKTLNVRVSDSKGLRDANTVFYELVDALGKVKNETERDALAMQVFGKSARDLNPLIEAGSGKLRELSTEAHAVGYVMSGETLASFGQLDDAMQRMNKQGDALKNSLAVALLPMLTALFETVGSIPVPVLQTVVTLVTAITTVVLAVKAIKELTGTASAVVGFFKGFDTAALKTTVIIVGIVAAITALLVVIATLAGKSKELQGNLGSIGSMTGNMTGSSSVPRYAKGTNFHPGGLATINDGNGYPGETVMLPRGSRVYPTTQGQGGNVYIDNITIDAKNVREFNDIVRIAEQQRQSQRQGYAGA